MHLLRYLYRTKFFIYLLFAVVLRAGCTGKGIDEKIGLDKAWPMI